MTIPHFPSPPGTVLFPNHTLVLQYHQSIFLRWNLSPYIRLHREVLAANWHGDNVSGHWQLTVKDRTHNRTILALFVSLSQVDTIAIFTSLKTTGLGGLSAWSRDTSLYLLP